jgi:hypothetical protein
MFFYSVDEHTLNVTEADGTGIYGRKFRPAVLTLAWIAHYFPGTSCLAVWLMGLMF